MVIIEALTLDLEKHFPKFNESNLLVNRYPDTPDNIVSLIDLGGVPVSRYAPNRAKKIEVKYRHVNYKDGIKLGNQIYNLYHSKIKYDMGDFFIVQSYSDSEVSYLYQDKKDRFEFSLELVFEYEI